MRIQKESFLRTTRLIYNMIFLLENSALETRPIQSRPKQPLMALLPREIRPEITLKSTRLRPLFRVILWLSACQKALELALITKEFRLRLWQRSIRIGTGYRLMGCSKKNFSADKGAKSGGWTHC